MGLKCERCTYRTGPYKLYYEVQTKARGRKSATANVGLQVGLSQNMLSNTGMRHILMSSNIRPPTYTGMQRQANRVGAAIQKMNEKDMRKHRLDLNKVQEMRGQSGDPILVEGDARYNNTLWSGAGKTPYQPATQTVYTMAENLTSKKKIIGVFDRVVFNEAVFRPAWPCLQYSYINY